MKTTTTTKVQSTQEVNTSYGLKHCCKGKLVIIPTNKKLEEGLLAQSKSIPEKFTILNYATVEAFKDVENCGWQIVDPIIVSETEKPNKGDWYISYLESEPKPLEHNGNCGDGFYNHADTKKILAMPENISPKQLQVIVDGKLKEGDEVLVGCIKIEDDEYKYTSTELFNDQHISYHVESDLKGYITLHKAKDETWDDVERKFRQYRDSLDGVQTISAYTYFLKNNYNIPTKK